MKKSARAKQISKKLILVDLPPEEVFGENKFLFLTYGLSVQTDGRTG
jgi:hypothetical protein